MFKNKIFQGILLIGIIAIIIYSLSGAEGYAEKIEKIRASHLEMLMQEKDSPIAQLPQFSGLKYYPADKKYLIDAVFVEDTKSKESLLLMTDSSQATITKAGDVSFDWEGQQISLSIFDEGEIYMLPFRDLTNKNETYGGGRYINIPKDALKNGKIEIDFNQAYNFYCAYNENYICPVPPKQNIIPIAITAGEKRYK